MKISNLSFRLVFLGLLLLEKNAWASSAEGGGGFSRQLLWQIVAFILLIIFLAKVLRKPLGNFLVKRKENIQNSLEQAKKRQREAERLLAEWEKKLDAMDEEIAALHRNIQQEGETERERMILRSQEEGDRIRKQAQVIAEQEVKKARACLKKETVDLTVELSEKLLEKAVQPEDQERLAKEYMARLKEIR